MGTVAGTTIDGLVLRNLAPGQADAFFRHIEENRDSYSDTIPFVSATRDIEAMRTHIARNLERQATGSAEFYSLWDEDRMAGLFLVREKDLSARWAEIGYMLGRPWRGKGVTEAICGRLLSELFGAQEMNKVVICCNDDNAASVGIARKLGFTLEGTLRDHFVVNGKVRNMLYFGLLRDEWTASKT